MKKLLLINLQLFAEQVINSTTSEGLSAENKTYYDKNLIRQAKPNLIHDQFAQKRPIPKNGGKTIEFREFAALPKATQPLTEGVTPAGKSLNVIKRTSEVSQYGDYVTMTDMIDMTAIDPVVVETLKLVGNQAGITLDTITRNILQSTTTVMYCPKSDGTVITSRNDLDDSCLLTVEVVKEAAAILKANNAPKIDGCYVAIVHPFVAKDIMDDPQWIDAYKYTTPENIFQGELGKIAGVRFVETSEAKVYADGIFGTLIFGGEAYGVTEIEGGGLETIVKPKGSAGTADPLNQRSSVGWKATKTAEILVPPYIYRIEGKSSLSAKAVEN